MREEIQKWESALRNLGRHFKAHWNIVYNTLYVCPAGLFFSPLSLPSSFFPFTSFILHPSSSPLHPSPSFIFTLHLLSSDLHRKFLTSISAYETVPPLLNLEPPRFMISDYRFAIAAAKGDRVITRHKIGIYPSGTIGTVIDPEAGWDKDEVSIITDNGERIDHVRCGKKGCFELRSK